jgi:hypothetical protein
MPAILRISFAHRKREKYAKILVLSLVPNQKKLGCHPYSSDE